MSAYKVLSPMEWEVYAREWELWTEGKLTEEKQEEELS